MSKIQNWFLALFTCALVSSPSFSDNLVVFGASGQFGSEIVREALNRGHQVYGVSRSPQNFNYTETNFIAVDGNPTELDSVKGIVAKADAILVALGDREAETPEDSAMNLAAIALTTALADRGKAGPPVVVLGGGNTSAATEQGMLDIMAARGGNQNARLKQIYLSQWVTYQTYKKSNINWTYVATPQNILGVTNDGNASRTGEYRAAADGSLDAEPNAGLSRADIAVAMVDFAESGEYSQMRVMVAQKHPNP